MVLVWTMALPSFDWDPIKAHRNWVRHGVTFEEAVTVFLDPDARIHDDPDHSLFEHREIIVGCSARWRVLLVSFTERRDTVRLISARRATPTERRLHEEATF